MNRRSYLLILILLIGGGYMASQLMMSSDAPLNKAEIQDDNGPRNKGGGDRVGGVETVGLIDAPRLLRNGICPGEAYVVH